MLEHQFSNCGLWILSGILELKTLFIILRVIYLIHYIGTCTDGMKAMLGTTAGTFAQIRAVPTKLYYSHRILSNHWTYSFNKKGVSTSNAFDEGFYFDEDF